MRTHTQARKEFIFPNISNEEKKILDLKDASKSYTYCLENRDAHIKLHEQIIIASKNVRIIYWFAMCVIGANVELLERALARCDVFLLFRDCCIQDLNVNRFQKIILDHRNETLLRMFIKNIKKMNLDEFFKEEIMPTNDIVLIDWYISKIGFTRSKRALNYGRVIVVDEI